MNSTLTPDGWSFRTRRQHKTTFNAVDSFKYAKYNSSSFYSRIQGQLAKRQRSEEQPPKRKILEISPLSTFGNSAPRQKPL